MEKYKTTEGKRLHVRYPLSQKVTFELSTPLTLQQSRSEEAEADAQNVSEGGLCLMTERSLEESQIIKIKLPIPNVAAKTPTLAEVRWVKREPSNRQQETVQHAVAGHWGGRYLVGLRFLF